MTERRPQLGGVEGGGVDNGKESAERMGGSMQFIDGGDITLRQSLEFIDRGSRSPHPGGGNNRTTFLMQEGVPTVMFWEVNAALDGYDATLLDGQRISEDVAKCNPWAQLDKEMFDEALSGLPDNIQELIGDSETAFQVHMALARAAFPDNVETSASFYLRNREIVEPILRVLAESRFGKHFSKLVKPDGTIVEALNQSGDMVVYRDGSRVKTSDLADGYLRLLDIVDRSEEDGLNPMDTGEWGVLPDARIMSVIDNSIYASTTGEDTTVAWAGTAMRQYILKDPDSQRWRETVSQMYGTVRTNTGIELPERLNFVLIPTNGLDSLLLADGRLANQINSAIQDTRIPSKFDSSVLREQFEEAIAGMSMQEAEQHLMVRIEDDKSKKKIRELLERGIPQGACGVAASTISRRWRTENQDDIDEAKERLEKVLVNGEGKKILHEQPTITPLEILQGRRLVPLEGVMDVPTGKLEAKRAELEKMANKRIKQMKREDNGDDNDPGIVFNRTGWYS